MTTTDTSRSGGPADTDGSGTSELELALSGMTCASCASRIERKLNKLDGVAATVNYATEKARVRFGAGVAPQDLVREVEKAGYGATLPQDAPEDGPDDAAALRTRFLACLALALPVIAFAMVPAWQFPGWQWVSLVLAAPVVLWGAWPFHRAAATNLAHGTATMDTLVSLGTAAAFLWSLWALVLGSAGEIGMVHPFSFVADGSGGDGTIYFEVAAGVTTFILAGRWFEARSKRRAGAALRALLDLGAKDVAVLRDGPDGTGTESRVPVDTLVVGDRFVVRPGEKIAADGTVEDGRSAVDRSMLTGESVPVEVGPGETVTGGCVNVGGRLVVRVTHTGEQTRLARMARLVEDAQNGKAEVQRLADRVSQVFVPIVLVIAVATFGFWLGAGTGTVAAFTAAVAVLIIACPCALGLATPTALLVGTGRGAQLGILIKGPEVLESTRRIDTVVLDKTGTVTSGEMAVADVTVATGEDTADVLRTAAAVEDASEHPIARAIVAAARDRHGAQAAVTDFASVDGLGVRGTVDGRSVLVGRAGLLGSDGVELGDELTAANARAQAAGRTVVAVAWDGRARGLVSVADTVKPTSAEAVAGLRALGLTPMLLTGDAEPAARAVAATVGIDPEDVIAEVLPSDKLDVVRGLQADGRVVAMVGDGVNDAAALAGADLGLAMGTGTDVAIEASDLTLVRGDLLGAVDAIRLARRTLGTIKANLFWAFAYNVAALPLAATGMLNPMIAGAAMAFSSVFVVSNSLRLRGFRAHHPAT